MTPAPGERPAASDVEREIERLEGDFYRLYSAESQALDAIVPLARATGDCGLLGRGLCLLGRAQIGRGRHELAARTAHEGVLALDRLEPQAADAHRAARAELLRTRGNALLKLGRNAEALALLEDAVTNAEAASAQPAEPRLRGHARHTLIRSLSNLGSALLAVREVDTAIDVYRRAAADDALDVDGAMLDDVLLAQWNLIDALHERVRRFRLAGDAAAAKADVESARGLLESAGLRLRTPSVTRDINAYSRQGYYAAFGQHLLLIGQPAEALAMFEQQMETIAREPAGGMYEWVLAVGHAGIAEASLALGWPHEALRHSAEALARFERHHEANERAPVLLVRAAALRQVGEDRAAYAELESYHALRARLEDESALRFARHVTAKLGLERARAEIESGRRIAATLETLGRLGQELTANLDADAVVRMLYGHVGLLVHAPAFAVWLLDEGAGQLTLAFGIEDGRSLTSQPIALADPVSWVARAARERRELLGAAGEPGAEPTRQLAGTRFMQVAMFAPLIAGRRALGVLSIQSDRAGTYGESERSILRTLCAYAAIALDNAAAYRELSRVVATLQTTQRELSLRTAEYERLSMTDALTGIANRRHFIERAKIEIDEARRNHSALAVAIFDIDHFKSVNDSHGHVAGDHVLQQVAQAGKDGLRSADFLARVGGEEFALLLPGAGPGEAAAIAERIRAAIEKLAIRVDAIDLRVTASFGVANVAAAEETFDEAFARADAALYRSKQMGRNRVQATPP